MKKILIMLVSVCVVLSIAVCACAAEFPIPPGSKIRIIVQYSPGGGYDVEARLAAPFIQNYLNNNGGKNITVYVENITGSAGILATTELYNSRPDGLNIMFICPETALLQQLTQKTQFDAMNFVCLGQQSVDAYGFFLRSDIPVKSLGELLELSKKEPILLGTSGKGDNDSIIPIIFAALLKDNGMEMNFDYIHFGGSGEIMASIRRKETMGGANVITGLMGMHNEGYGKFIFTFTKERHPMLQDVPTFGELLDADDRYSVDEASLNDFLGIAKASRFYVAPPKTPDNIANLYAAALKSVLTDPEFLKKAADAGRFIDYVDAAGARNTIENEYRTYSKTYVDIITKDLAE